jgi:hypothetical protein
VWQHFRSKFIFSKSGIASNTPEFTALKLAPPNLSYFVRLASDDLAAYVPSSLKQQICKGEYENLSLLLKGTVDILQFCSGSIFTINADGQIETVQRECEEKIMSIEKWTHAFIIYTSIYLLNQPDKVNDIYFRPFIRRLINSI